MKTSLYNPIYETTQVMMTPALILNTQEKRRAYAAIGASQERNANTQDSAQGTLVAQSKIRKWNMNAVSEAGNIEPPQTTDKTSALIFAGLAALAVTIGIALSVKLIRGKPRKSKKA